jgi:hypothetical protein
MADQVTEQVTEDPARWATPDGGLTAQYVGPERPWGRDLMRVSVRHGEAPGLVCVIEVAHLDPDMLASVSAVSEAFTDVDSCELDAASLLALRQVIDGALATIRSGDLEDGH